MQPTRNSQYTLSCGLGTIKSLRLMISSQTGKRWARFLAAIGSAALVFKKVGRGIPQTY